MNHKDVRKALNSRFSTVEFGDRNIRHVLDRTKGEPVMKTKTSMALALSILAVLGIGIAVAASVNVFDLFARYEGNEYLAKLDQAAQSYEDQVVEIPPEGPYPAAKFMVNQAYYDGKSLVIAYTLSEQWIPVRFLNPEDALSENNDLVSEKHLDMPKPYLDYILSPQDLKLIEGRLAAGGKVYVEGWSQSINDTYVMAGDVRIGAEQLNLSHMPDGTTVGYIEFDDPLPQEVQDQEELSIEFLFSRGWLQLYEDETGFYYKGASDGQVNLPVTIRRNARSPEMLYGDVDFDDYHVTATASISDIEIKVHLILSASAERIREFAEKSRWLGYDLYAGDEKCAFIGQNDYHDENSVTLDISYMLPGNPENLRLVPQYAHLGRQIEDVVPLQ